MISIRLTKELLIEPFQRDVNWLFIPTKNTSQWLSEFFFELKILTFFCNFGKQQSNAKIELTEPNTKLIPF